MQSFNDSLGKGGNIWVSASESMEIFDQSSLTATTSGDGDAGNITIDVKEDLLMSGNGRIFTSTVGIDNFILGFPLYEGNAGNISISTNRISVE